MRMPNGYGSVYKLSGRRRKPWAARKTIGWKNQETDHPLPIYQFIGFYATRAEAMDALAKFNRDPYIPMSATLQEIYEKWSDRHYSKIKPSTIHIYKAAARHLEAIKDVPVKDLTLPYLQAFIDNSGMSVLSAKQVKLLLGAVLDYALQYDYISADQLAKLKYLDFSRLKESAKTPRRVFTNQEIAGLWKSSDPFAPCVLSLIFTGLRISEYLAITPEKISDGCIHVTESKTAAGVRIVPIADKLRPFIPDMVPKCNYSTFWKNFKNLCPSHTIHDTRHTFISLCADAGIDQRIIKTIVGHAGDDITSEVYTHLDIQVLRDAVNLLLVCY